MHIKVHPDVQIQMGMVTFQIVKNNAVTNILVFFTFDSFSYLISGIRHSRLCLSHARMKAVCPREEWMIQMLKRRALTFPWP